jgi:shikimate dehydrogenase
VLLPRIVDGATKVLGIVGDPVAQVRSPPLWSALFRYNRINAICIPFCVQPPDFERFLDGVRAAGNVLGLFATVPHKMAAARHAARLTPRARKVGTANALRPLPEGGWEADMLDGLGFVRALRADGQRIEGRRAIVVGAGGVGCAIAFALAEAGAVSIAISDIDPDRAAALSRRIVDLSGVASSVSAATAEGFDLIVNASPMGMRAGDAIPVNLSGLDAGSIVGDVVISRELTPILRQARERGCHVQPGAAMTDHQVSAMAGFLGLDSGDWSVGAIRAALREQSGQG